MINLYNVDCMDFMRNLPDKAYDLAIVDPPYGDGGGGNGTASGQDSEGALTGTSKTNAMRTGGHFESHKKQLANMLRGVFDADIAHWDYAPSKEYFELLFRVSKNQIIWGGNYFDLPPNRCFLIWKKLTISESFSLAMCEYAWTSFNQNAKLFECAPQGKKGDPRFHPTQKPVALYKWLLSNYAKPGNRILDTHLGSGSIAIACHDLGFDLDGCEIDPDYFKAASERLERHKEQQTFDFAGGNHESI